MALAVSERGQGSLERMLASAARQITRWSVPDALAALRLGTRLIDIRAADARTRDGVIPGSLHIPRTVLEWRVAVDSPWRSPHVGGVDEPLILICDHGFSSVLAARALVELGFSGAGDVIGGFAAWRSHGLPHQPPVECPQASGRLPGQAPPEPWPANVWDSHASAGGWS